MGVFILSIALNMPLSLAGAYLRSDIQEVAESLARGILALGYYMNPARSCTYLLQKMHQRTLRNYVAKKGRPSLPEKIFIGSMCAVCLEQFDVAGTIALLSCGHIFHVSCYTICKERQTRCPICRKEVVEEAQVMSFAQLEKGLNIPS